MIKLDDNIEIASFHNEKVKDYIKNCLQFYINCIDVNNGTIQIEDINRNITNLNGNTKIGIFNTIIDGEIQNKDGIINCLKEKKLSSEINNSTKNFLNNMLNVESEIYFEKIILGKPNELRNIYDSIKNKHKVLFNKSFTIKPIYVNILSKLFDYNKFSSKGRGFKYKDLESGKIKSWGAYELFKKLNINVCPYCNRQYTNTIHKKGKDIIRPDVEHFLPQYKYPMFAISFYNLIPSCNDCNSVLKGDKEFQIDEVIHPYMENKKNINLNRPIFDINMDVLKLEDIKNHIDDIEISIEKEYKGKCKGEENLDFINKIEAIYDSHKDLVADLLDKLYIYTDEMIDEICMIIDDDSITRDRLYDAIFCEPKDEYEVVNTSLGKLKKDIITIYRKKYIS